MQIGHNHPGLLLSRKKSAVPAGLYSNVKLQIQVDYLFLHTYNICIYFETLIIIMYYYYCELIIFSFNIFYQTGIYLIKHNISFIFKILKIQLRMYTQVSFKMHFHLILALSVLDSNGFNLNQSNWMPLATIALRFKLLCETIASRFMNTVFGKYLPSNQSYWLRIF